MSEFDFNITDKRREFLSKLGLKTPFQVLNYLPRRYADFTPSVISSEQDGNRVVLKGMVTAKDRLFRIKRNLNRFTFKVNYQQDEYKIVVFNRDYYYSNIEVGKAVLTAGKLDYYHREVVATDLFVKDLDKITVRPLYSLIHGVKDYEFSRVVGYSYTQLVNEGKLNEVIPAELLTKYRLISRRQAYYWAHFPTSLEEVKQAKRYLKYEEALVYSLMMQKLRAVSASDSGSSNKVINLALIQTFIQSLPYQLTKDQLQAAHEIIADLQGPKNMYRLLQGDVGSGKTIVATIALLGVVSAGYQGALMAPTDILARQHYATLTKLLQPFGINVTLLVSALDSETRQTALQDIQSGKAQIIIGTHALIQEGVHYHKLGLCVIDEQHRFGVEQRKMLHEKGDAVELLLLSATPIPRTLAITIFQDLDVSTLLVPPVASKDIHTQVIHGHSVSSITKQMEATLARHEKIYVVCSLIENELSDYQNVTAVYEEMQKRFPQYPVYLLHGKLKEEEKLRVMQAFQKAPAAILVSTTVIEVGIDIKEATMMVVFDANCFGLAQLHQLRGRIGRGGQTAWCYLLCDTTEVEANERLQFLSEHSDGFEVARYDLSLRGPGDITGLAQSGSFGFQMCNIFEDFKIFEYARGDAKAILAQPADSKNQPILKFLDDYMAKDVAVIE